MTINVYDLTKARKGEVRTYRVHDKSPKGLLKEIMIKEHGCIRNVLKDWMSWSGVKRDFKGVIQEALATADSGTYDIGIGLKMEIVVAS